MIVFENYGWCPCCGTTAKFVSSSNWWRDDYRCTSCDSIPRERAVMYCIERFFPNWRDLVIHETSAIVDRGLGRRLRAENPNYIPSQYYPEVEPGASWKGMRCENFEKMSFADESVDLHVSQDVFEHLLDPAAAFSEVARTLRPGGAHVFTTPLVRKNLPTEFCARRGPQGETLQLIHPPEHHLNPVSSDGSLVTTRWGYDIASYIARQTGLFTSMVVLDVLEQGIRAEYIEVLVTRKPVIAHNGG